MLTIDLSVDIKNVIDLEDVTEAAIQSEIENYIITEGLAKEYDSFISTYLSNKSGTGAWLSGFYGSGKSYFGKILGYLLSNQKIGGSPSRERILQRFTGLQNDSIIKNSISRLDTVTSRVVFLDIAKQCSSNDDKKKGLAFILFINFLRSLGLPTNEHGMLLYQILIQKKMTSPDNFVQQVLGQDWNLIKSKVMDYAKAIKDIFLQTGRNEDDYKNIIETIRRDIDYFTPARFKEELANYLDLVPNEKLVFLFDEASEAINQGKINLLDLEGVSEALSALGSKVWTIAIAQEKLDDVINNAQVSKAQLTKVTDRFQTKIHLEATEVDVIIRQRLLQKNPKALELLKDHYQKNSGKIANHALLNAIGITKTDNLESFSTYYPFYKYQFDLLQNFLFGSKGLASTKVAARGMIITTYEILKHEVAEEDIFAMVCGWQIAKQADPQPKAWAVNRFDNAEQKLKNDHYHISGRHLLETLHFLSGAEAKTTLSNITKSFSANIEVSASLQEEISKALEDLVEAKTLLNPNHEYKITSDLEQKFLDDMTTFSVQGYIKKKQLISLYKSSQLVRQISRLQDSATLSDFYITTDNDDELASPTLKYLKIKIKSLYTASDNPQADIENLRMRTQNDKDMIWLVPDNSRFNEIDRLIDKIERIKFLLEKYTNLQGEERTILQSFQTEMNEKENHLKILVEEVLQKSTAIYLFNTAVLDQSIWQSTLQKLQKQMITNVYTKKLDNQIEESIAGKMIKEGSPTRLCTFFTPKEFQFFDKLGNFIGENLKVTSEILHRINSNFVDGKSLEKDLEEPPTGYSFGTIKTTLAVLMRAGKLVVKFNGREMYTWKEEEVRDLFENSQKFRNSSFKAILKSLSLQQKKEIVEILLDFRANHHLNKKIDFNANDFELVSTIHDLAKYYCYKIDSLFAQSKDFNDLFADIKLYHQLFLSYTVPVNDNNYIDVAEQFLSQASTLKEAIDEVSKAESFLAKHLVNVVKWHCFMVNVGEELNKSNIQSHMITTLSSDFFSLYQSDIVRNFQNLEILAQQIKDEYFKLMDKKGKEMSALYTQLLSDSKKLMDEINKLAIEDNDAVYIKIIQLHQYAKVRSIKEVDIDFFEKDRNSHFALSEFINFIELYPNKKTELEILKTQIVRVKPPTNPPGEAPKEKPVHKTNLPKNKRLKVSEYKSWLQGELTKLASVDNNDEIEIGES